MLICEDLLLLLTQDDGRREPWVGYRDYGLAGGLLGDLVLAQCVDLKDEKRSCVLLVPGLSDGAGGIELEGAPPPGDGPEAVLDFGLRVLAQRSKPPRSAALVQAGWFNPRKLISRSLVARGVVGFQEARFLGLQPERYPAVDPEPEAQTRARLTAALAGQGRIGPADAMILGILQAMNAAKSVLGEEMRAAGITRGGCRGELVGRRGEFVGRGAPPARVAPLRVSLLP